ncbi:MAG: hypothetical protein HXL30_03725, partial [Prevotellaceae bacterium]|nr:hypothetical protein [Prevotellaceae bacterium]
SYYYAKSKKVFKLKQDGSYQEFLYEKNNGKYYLKTTQGDATGQYLSNASGTLKFSPSISADAVIEIINPNGGSATEVTLNAKKMRATLALFQAHRQGTAHSPNNFFGTGLGQYPVPTLANNTFDYATYNLYLEGHAEIGNGNAASEKEKMDTFKDALKLNLPKSGTFVVVTTKSQYEDAVRANAKTFRTKVDIDAAAGPSQSAKYLKASDRGYTLTDNKSEAAVFFFDGEHLTGIDNGFGLGEAKYDLTASAQTAVIAQGKLEKTLDAGSYSLKVGDKFVKLDRDNGLSPSTNESDSHLFLEEATKFTLNTDELGYISFFAPTAVKVPAGVEVYSGNINAQNSVITFNKVNTQEIPAKTAVLLRKVTGKGSFEVEKIASTTSTIGNNSLKGYTVSSSDHLSNAYGLTVENNKLVFKPLTQGVRAFRAVIYNNNAAGAPAYYPTAFTPEGIQGVTVDDNQAEVFDLAGRRVEAPVKGQVYVKNGKKFIQK